MKFSEIKNILEKKFGEITCYETKKILELAFPGAVTERTTYVYGIRPSPPSPSSGSSLQQPLQISAVSVPDHELLKSENVKLKEKVSNLETKLASMEQSSLMVANIESETEQLISCSCISDGPNTIDHLNSFCISAILSTIKAKPPNLLQLFQTLGNTSRNLSEGHLGLAVEQLKALVSLCTLRIVYTNCTSIATGAYIYLYSEPIEQRGCSY